MAWKDKYTGRGLDWRKGPVTNRAARRIARYRMGLVIESVVNEGWSPDDLEKRFGPEGVEMIKTHMLDLARWLEETGDPDGEPVYASGRRPT